MSYSYACMICKRRIPDTEVCNCDGTTRPRYPEPYATVARSVVDMISYRKDLVTAKYHQEQSRLQDDIMYALKQQFPFMQLDPKDKS